MIQYILLGFLRYQPMTGYDLKRNIDCSTGHFWHAHHSQIYTSLRDMEANGLVSSQFIREEGQPERRVYTLTEAGLTTLTAWLEQTQIELSTVKDELLVRIFFSAPRDKAKITAELILQRELHQKKLAEYQKLSQDVIHQNKPMHTSLEHEAVFWEATLRMGVRYEMAYIDWLNETIQILEELK